MMLNEWLRCLKECRILRPGKLIRGRSSQDAYLVYAKAVKNGSTGDQMHFKDFLNALMYMGIGMKSSCSAIKGTRKPVVAQDAYADLLRKYVLPNAKRLEALDISHYVADKQIKDLEAHYEPALLGIFNHYAKHRGDSMVKRTAWRKAQLRLDSCDRGEAEHCISVQRWAKLCNDFGLNRVLSTCKLVHIYLSSAVTVDASTRMHELKFRGFWGALLRTAEQMYTDPTHSQGVPLVNQVRGLFLWMFRAISGELREFVSYQQTRKSFEITKSDQQLKPQVCKVFSKIFLSDWQAANFDDFGLYDEAGGVYHTSQQVKSRSCQVRFKDKDSQRRNSLASR